MPQQIRQYLRSDKVGSIHKALLLGILLDEAIASENCSAVRSANISMQINNYGDLSRDEIIARLQGPRLTRKLGERSQSWRKRLVAVDRYDLPDGSLPPKASFA